MNRHMSEMRQTIRSMKERRKEEMELLKQSRLFRKSTAPSVPAVAFFTHSVSLGAYGEQEHLLIGKFQLVNTGERALHAPVILLNVKCEKEFRLNGKFAPGEGKGGNGFHEWERIKGKGDPQTEFWLRPTRHTLLEPGASLSFPDFQVRFQLSEGKSIALEGFFYCEELPEGIASSNSISIHK